MGRTYQLKRTQFIPRPRDEVFAFFCDARNLERITPEFLHFHILLSEPARVHAGMTIDYRLRLFGLPFHWRSRIESFEPGVRFSDVQLRGPYRRWHHLHEFTDVEGGTQMFDRVEYEMPLGPLGTLAHALSVRRTLERIFDYRREAIARQFGGHEG